eukprot:366775-Pelagomonas_calceolata.AAC.10
MFTEEKQQEAMSPHHPYLGLHVSKKLHVEPHLREEETNEHCPEHAEAQSNAVQPLPRCPSLIRDMQQFDGGENAEHGGPQDHKAGMIQKPCFPLTGHPGSFHRVGLSTARLGQSCCLTLKKVHD